MLMNLQQAVQLNEHNLFPRMIGVYAKFYDKHALRDLFNTIDIDGNGFVTLDEASLFLNEPCF